MYRPIIMLLSCTQDTVLSSISAAVHFGLAVSLATVIDAHATLIRNIYRNSSYYGHSNDYDYDSQYPITVPAKAAAVSVNNDCMYIFYFSFY